MDGPTPDGGRHDAIPGDAATDAAHRSSKRTRCCARRFSTSIIAAHRPHVPLAAAGAVGIRHRAGGDAFAVRLGRQDAHDPSARADRRVLRRADQRAADRADPRCGRAGSARGMSVAVAQMLWSGVLIHLTGGRIETHFHVFGSLAFLAFYRDWRVLRAGHADRGADHSCARSSGPNPCSASLEPGMVARAGARGLGRVRRRRAGVRMRARRRACSASWPSARRASKMAHSNVEEQVVERTRQLEAEDRRAPRA